MSPPTNHPGANERQFKALVEGFRQVLPASEEQVLFGGREMTMAELVADLERVMDRFAAVHRAEAAFRQAVRHRQEGMRACRAVLGDAVVFLKHRFGRESPRLMSFGLKPPRPRTPLSVEASAVARAKAAATRKARGILGRKQRLGLGRPPEPTLEVFGPDGKPLLGSGGGAAMTEPSEPAEPEPGGAG